MNGRMRSLVFCPVSNPVRRLVNARGAAPELHHEVPDDLKVLVIHFGALVFVVGSWPYKVHQAIHRAVHYDQ